MSANNQILVKEYKGSWYIFETMAESWCVWNSEKQEVDESKTNELLLTSALDGPYATKDRALVSAHQRQDKLYTEYGVHLKLAKDAADVTVIDDRTDGLGYN